MGKPARHACSQQDDLQTFIILIFMNFSQTHLYLPILDQILYYFPHDMQRDTVKHIGHGVVH